MKTKRKLLSIFLLMAVTLSLSFSEGNKETAKKKTQEITVITHRTDLVDNLFQEYVAEFNKIYPDIKVNYESITDYEGEIKIRMNTKQYGDLLMIPDTGFAISELPDFFEPLGTAKDMAAKYEFTTDKEFNGMVV